MSLNSLAQDQKSSTPSKSTSLEIKEYEGIIEPSRIIQLSSPVDGLIESVTVDRGDKVKKGQIIATLESSVEKAILDLSKARTELEGEQKKQNAKVELTQTKYNHDKELHEKGFLSDEELDQSKTNMLLAQAELIQANEAIRLANLERKRAEAVLSLRTIRSPIDGVVTERFLSPGELVTRQLQSKILTIAQVSPLIVQVMLPAKVFGDIRKGDSAQVRTVISPEQAEESIVIAVDKVIDSASDTFRVKLKLLTKNIIAPGVRCKVRFSD